MWPKVTLGLTLKDCSRTLTATFDSILSQTYPHNLIEIIIVNDGSKDDTSKKIKDFVKKIDMPTKIFEQPWRGLGYSRNLIVKNARGKYLIWVDGDMILAPDFVTKQVEFMERFPKIAIAKARYGILKSTSVFGFLENASFMAADKIYGGRCTSRVLGTGGSIYRLDVIRQVNGFDEKITGGGEDLDIEYRIRAAGWSLFLATDAIFYEQRRNSLYELVKEAFWHGFGSDYIFKKNQCYPMLLKLNPAIAFLVGAWYAKVAYHLTYRRIVMLLPFYWLLRRFAWFLGFSIGLIKHIQQRNCLK